MDRLALDAAQADCAGASAAVVASAVVVPLDTDKALDKVAGTVVDKVMVES